MGPPRSACGRTPPAGRAAENELAAGVRPKTLPPAAAPRTCAWPAYWQSERVSSWVAERAQHSCLHCAGSCRHYCCCYWPAGAAAGRSGAPSLPLRTAPPAAPPRRAGWSGRRPPAPLPGPPPAAVGGRAGRRAGIQALQGLARVCAESCLQHCAAQHNATFEAQTRGCITRTGDRLRTSFSARHGACPAEASFHTSRPCGRQRGVH